MSERFIKFIPSEDALHLITKYPNAFAVLTVIAERARRENGHADGLLIGDALISSTDLEPGLSRQNFRTALEKLVELGQLKIISNGKNYKENLKMTKNPTIKVTIKGMLVNLCKSTIWDINYEGGNQHINQHFSSDQPTTNQRPNGRIHTVRRKKKELDKEYHPQTPSGGVGLLSVADRLSDDFSSKKEIEVIPGVSMSEADLEKCIAIRGSLESVRYAVEQIQSSEKRKATIRNWPNALESWNVGEDPQIVMKKNSNFADKICSKFREFSTSNAWRCFKYWDEKTEVHGVLFEYVSVYRDPIFVPFFDKDFEQKCREILGVA